MIAETSTNYSSSIHSDLPQTGIDLELTNLLQAQGFSEEDAKACLVSLTESQKKIMLDVLGDERKFGHQELLALGLDPAAADLLVAVQGLTSVFGLPMVNFMMMLIQLLRESSAHSKEIMAKLREGARDKALNSYESDRTAAFIDIGFGATTAGLGMAIGAAGLLKGQPKLNDKGQPIPNWLDKYLPTPITYSTVSQGWSGVGQGVSGLERAEADLERFEKDELLSLFELIKTDFDEINQKINSTANAI